MNIQYPADVIRELMVLREQSETAVKKLFELENAQVEAEIAADRIEAKALLDSTGTVVERQAFAKYQALDARREAELARVKVNYAKNRMRQLSEATNAVQTASRMIDLGWKVAGVESR
jgi:hypothetical protein